MPTIKTQGGKVITKDGKVSCVCCGPPSVPCGTPVVFFGGQSNPSVHTIQLGSGTGTVELIFNALVIPDRFVVAYNGEDVIDTDFVSGLGTAEFVKTTATPTIATVFVYAPAGGTLWDFRLLCPTQAP